MWKELSHLPLEKSVEKKKKIKWDINKKRKVDCTTFNVIYAIICKKNKCKETYIGETKRILKSRIADHCWYVRNGRLDKATGAHFNLPDHSLADLPGTILEQSKRNNDPYRKQREEYHINRFNTFHIGMNWQKKKTLLEGRLLS